MPSNQMLAEISILTKKLEQLQADNEKLLEDVKALTVNPNFKGLPCTALSQINRLITYYQKERN